MSYKSELNAIIKRHEYNLADAIHQIDQARNSGSYTPQGLQSFIESLNGSFTSQATSSRNAALNMISKAEEAFKKHNQRIVVANLKDAGVQMGLANAVNLLERGGISDEDFECIIEAFRDDSFAMNCIKAALHNSKNGAVYAELMPYTYDDQIGLFDKLRTNIAKYIRPVSVDNNSGAQMGIQWLLKSIEALDDDLLLPEQRVS